MKRKCVACNYYNNGVCDMGENGTEYDEPFCELGHSICNFEEEENKFCCYLSDKAFEQKERKYLEAEEAECRYWHKIGLSDDHIHNTLFSLISKIKSVEDIDAYEVEKFLYDNDIKLKIVGDTELRIIEESGYESSND